MNLKNRLTKLERRVEPEMMPLLMVPTAENRWAPKQLHEMEEAEIQGRMILKINFVKPKEHVDD